MYVSIEYFRLSPKVLYSVWNVMTQIQLIAQLEKTKNISISHRNSLTTTHVLMHHPKCDRKAVLYHRVNSNPQQPAQSQKNKISSIHNKNYWFEISNIVKILPDLDRSCRILADLEGV